MPAVWFRSVDRRYPFRWESELQPPGRWHAAGEGPALYLADTPDGAWAEFLRHEEITDPDDLAGIIRSLWAIEIDDDEPVALPALSGELLLGGVDSYLQCQEEARRLRGQGETALEAPSAALVDGGARGEVVNGGLVEADDRDGRVRVLYGERGEVRGWLCADGAPRERIIPLVRPL